MKWTEEDVNGALKHKENIKLKINLGSWRTKLPPPLPDGLENQYGRPMEFQNYLLRHSQVIIRKPKCLINILIIYIYLWINKCKCDHKDKYDCVDKKSKCTPIEG